MNHHTHPQRRESGLAPARRTRIAGFAMIEVLVAILIVSFGLLAVAGLQANTAKLKINSWARSAASVQFSDISDRIRANAGQAGLSFSAAGSAASASAYSYTADWATQIGVEPTITTDCMASVCTPAERATYDLLIWRSEVRRMFPQGSVFITGNRATGINATVAWFDKQFVTAARELDRSAVCGSTTAAGAARINCCPAGLVGSPAEPGVRCTNISFVP